MNLMNSTPTVSRFPDKTWVHADDASGLYAISRRKSTGWCDITFANIRTLRNLKSGWDSYGARSVDLDSINNAIALVRELATVTGIPRPSVSATPSGLVALMWTWQSGDRELDVLILRSGSFRYSLSDESNSSRDREGVTEYPEQLAVMLTAA